MQGMAPPTEARRTSISSVSGITGRRPWRAGNPTQKAQDRTTTAANHTGITKAQIAADWTNTLKALPDSKTILPYVLCMSSERSASMFTDRTQLAKDISAEIKRLC